MATFLRVYEQTGRLSEAARIAGVSRQTHYNRCATDPAYRQAFELAEERAGQTLEDEAARRAIAGVQHPVMYKGVPVKLRRRILYTTQYSDMLLLALLRRFRPALYGGQAASEHTGSAGIDIVSRLQAARRRLAETHAAAG